MFGDAPRSGHEAYSYGNKDSKNMSTANNATLFLSYVRINPRSMSHSVPPRPTAPLQRPGVRAAVQIPSRESVETIATLPGVSVSKPSLEEMLRDAAQDFDAFYQPRTPDPADGSIWVAAVDGKGIPRVKPAGAQPSV